MHEINHLRQVTIEQKEEIALLNDQLKEKEELQESLKIRESELERGFQRCLQDIERLELEMGKIKGAKEAERKEAEYIEERR